ncbi:MAG: class I SAM-dependent methyltransferase [Candidatus Thermoplasmatota archaeon]|nr:class I SAM-dependent methyltransferase [Candidatus Thermoplasmatota archaeon]
MTTSNQYGINNDTVERFARYMEKYPELYHQLADQVSSLTNSDKPIILDVGMGPGLLTAAISQKIPQAVIIGLEPQEKMLHFAQRKSKKSFSIIQAESGKLPISNNLLDIIVTRFSIPYWPDPSESIKELFRVLRPGGHVIFNALNKDYSRLSLILIKLHMAIRGAQGDVIRYHMDAYTLAYTEPQLRTMLVTGGFIVSPVAVSKKDWQFILTAQKPL